MIFLPNGSIAPTLTIDSVFDMQKLAWGSKVDANFRAKILTICEEFNWSPLHANWLMACMAFESAETFSPTIKNAAGSGAIGLIQFMPATARGLGTTTERLAQLSALDQLNYVRDYFRPYARYIKNLSDMYMAILMPKYVGLPDSSILFNTPTIAYRQNSGLDWDKDGTITKGEAAALVKAKLDKGMRAEFAL